LVAIRVAEGKDRPAPDKAIDTHRFARAVIDELHLRKLHQQGLAVRPILNSVTPDEPTTGSVSRCASCW
jgi:hypothetical protein